MPIAKAAPARQALDSALLQIESKAPEFGPEKLSNHAPMTVEALAEMGRAEAVGPWLAKYLPILDELPAIGDDADAVPERVQEPEPAAWGDPSSFEQWRCWFDQELAGSTPSSVLNRWVAKLAAGASGALGHGLLRTAHAARAVAREKSAPRLRELAQGLAYWASSYQTLPPGVESAKCSPLGSPTAAAIAFLQVPRLSPSKADLSLQQRLREVSLHPDFAAVPSVLQTDGNCSEFVSDLVTSMARVYSANIDIEEGATNAVVDLAFVHAITLTSAVRLLSHYVTQQTLSKLLTPIWTFNAAVYSSFSHLDLSPNDDNSVPDPEPGVGEVGGRFGELIDEAIIGADEHGIKFTEVCVREVRAGASRELLVLSRLVVARLVVAELKRKRAEKLARKQAR